MMSCSRLPTDDNPFLMRLITSDDLQMELEKNMMPAMSDVTTYPVLT